MHGTVHVRTVFLLLQFLCVVLMTYKVLCLLNATCRKEMQTVFALCLQSAASVAEEQSEMEDVLC